MLAANTDKYPAIDLEYAEGGTLYDLAFRTNDNNNNIELRYCESVSTPDMLRELVTGCLQALHFLHDDVGIIHNDIKPCNILLHRGIPKITDLGLCTLKDTPPRRRIGTFGYIAPEVFELRLECEGKTDVFSLGLTLFEVFEGEQPTPIPKEFQHAWRMWLNGNDQERGARSNELRREARRFFNPRHFSSRLMDGKNTLPDVLERDVAYIVAEMLRINVDKRPTAARCLEMLSSLRPAATTVDNDVRIHVLTNQTPNQQRSNQPTIMQGVRKHESHPSCVLLSKTPHRQNNNQPIAIVVDNSKAVIEANRQANHEKLKLLKLAREFAREGTCRDPELLAMLNNIRKKSVCLKNEYADRLLKLLHKRPEFADKRQKLFELIVKPGHNWWHSHKKQRALLRAKYEGK
jgi:serine/threonine protein kinase